MRPRAGLVTWTKATMGSFWPWLALGLFLLWGVVGFVTQ